MAANGASTAQIAAVVSAAALPWSLKLVNGFIIDRYTYLPMGRRRAWIIGAQALIVVALLAGALISPSHSDILALSILGFCANAAVTFQDVGIDSLAIDIMPEAERARAGGMMGGAQLIGISVTTAAGGYLLDGFGLGVCLAALALIPEGVMLYGIAIREREGERRLPWTGGASHPHNIGLQVAAWWPLLRNAFFAIIAPLSLLFIPALIARSLPWGGFEAFHPTLFQEAGGFSLTDYTNFTSALNLGAGLFAMTIGALLVEKLGAQRALMIGLVGGIVSLTSMGLLSEFWTQAWFLMGFMIAMEGFQAFYFVAMIAMSMRLCNPIVAATQFTIYTAAGNFGRPLGASLAAATAGQGNPELFYWLLAASWTGVLAIVLLVRFPGENRAQHVVAESLPQGEGVAARVN